MSIRSMAILTDVTKCIGCEKCVEACKQLNDLPKDRPWRWVKQITDLSSSRWTTILDVQTTKGRRFVRRQCRHCLEPACVEACIVGALTKSPEGPVVYNPDTCIGCRYCMVACPWEIPKYSWEDRVPLINKCTMCYDRVKQEGKLPACIEACPTQATIFGERDKLLAEAHRRLRANPELYLQKVWGEHEVGGTSVLYISDVDLKLDELVKPISDETPVPRRTFQVLKRMPMVFAGMGALMGGVYWIIERRQKLMAAEAGAEAEQPTHSNDEHSSGEPSDDDPNSEQGES